MDAVDWEATPVGSTSSWPQSLRTALKIINDSRFPMVVMWGPELVLFYNASYAPMLGNKHPWALGKPVREVWPEIWDTIGPMLEGVRAGEGATFSEDLMLALHRSGYLEECYFTFSYSPIADEGEIPGILCAVVETSRKVIAERRLRALHAIESRSLTEVMAANPIDIPFARIYVYDANNRPVLLESSGAGPAENESWPIEAVASTRNPDVVPSEIEAYATLVREPVRVESAMILPLAAAGQRIPIGAMVVGLSPFSRLDREYRRFLELLVMRIAAEINSARAIETRERATVELRTLSDAIPQIVCTAGPDGEIDYFNQRWFQFTGLNLEESFENAGWLDAVHPDDREAVHNAWRDAGRTGEDFAIEMRIRSAAGEYRWFLERGVPLRADDGSVLRLFASATDINDRKLLEEREAFFSHVSEVLGSTLDEQTVLQRITELCVPTFADWCQVQCLSADGELIVEAVRHADAALNKRLESLLGRSVVSVRDTTLGSPQVLRKAESRVLDHEATVRAVRVNVSDPIDRQVYEAAGLGTALIVPLVVRGQTRGTLHLVNVDPNSRRSEIAVEIAEELARRAALAIDNSRLYEREHRVASALQRAMLPAHLPSNSRIELSYAYRPAERESRVGGDWYDAFPISDNEMAISIGDVAGHGLEASVAMNEARQAFRLSALEGLSPAQTLRRANAALMINEERAMITAIFGVIDLKRSVFRYSCAGHPPPAIVPLAGRARYIPGGGIPIGVEPDVEFPMHEIELEPYATLLLYTDGLIEFGRNIDRESNRLLEALNQRVHDKSADGAGMLLRYVLDNRQLDDIAVLVATVLPSRAGSVELRLPAAPASAAIARRFVSRYARVARLEPERAFDLVIAVGEAVANAVEHAYRDRPGDFVLRLDVQEGKIVGEVADLGTWRDTLPCAERGRGLSILRATTRKLELNHSERGTTVAFAI